MWIMFLALLACGGREASSEVRVEVSDAYTSGGWHTLRVIRDLDREVTCWMSPNFGMYCLPDKDFEKVLDSTCDLP